MFGLMPAQDHPQHASQAAEKGCCQKKRFLRNSSLSGLRAALIIGHQGERTEIQQNQSKADQDDRQHGFLPFRSKKNETHPPNYSKFPSLYQPPLFFSHASRTVSRPAGPGSG